MRRVSSGALLCGLIGAVALWFCQWCFLILADGSFYNVAVLFQGEGCEGSSVTIGGKRLIKRSNSGHFTAGVKYPVLAETARGSYTVGVLDLSKGESYLTFGCRDGVLEGSVALKMVKLPDASH